MNRYMQIIWIFWHRCSTGCLRQLHWMAALTILHPRSSFQDMTLEQPAPLVRQLKALLIKNSFFSQKISSGLMMFFWRSGSFIKMNNIIRIVNLCQMWCCPIPRLSQFFYYCSFFARPKNEPKKGAGNDNFTPAVRPLHKPNCRYRPGWSSHHFRIPCAPYL